LSTKLIQVPKFEFEATIQIEQKYYKSYNEPLGNIEIKTNITNYKDMIDLYETKTEFSTKLIA
jgi:hypothetical protein